MVAVGSGQNDDDLHFSTQHTHTHTHRWWGGGDAYSNMSKTVTISPSSLNAVDVFNSCIVYTIPVHITYSTANSFLHTHTIGRCTLWKKKPLPNRWGDTAYVHLFQTAPSPSLFPYILSLQCSENSNAEWWWNIFTLCIIILCSINIKF